MTCVISKVAEALSFTTHRTYLGRMGHPTVAGAIPATRQKNCTACVLAKRRCDRRMPVCKRCVDRKIDCVYAKAVTISGAQAPDTTRTLPTYMDMNLDHLQFESSACSPFSFSPGIPLDSEYLDFMTVDSQIHTVETSSGTNRDYPPSSNPFADMLDGIGGPNLQKSLVSTDHITTIERPSSPVDQDSLNAYDKMADICGYLEPWMLYDQTSPLYHVVTRVKRFISDAATRNATPFMHRYLYKDNTPSCILDCFATNVLYTNRNPSNMTMVMRALHRNVSDIVRTQAVHTNATVAEKLARTQALFLYQVIRLFDGDVTLRAQGEADIPLLQGWLCELCKVRDNLGNLEESEQSLVRVEPPQEWERWIFAESLRRTIIMAYSVITLYQMMKNAEGPDDQSAWTYTHRWTLSRHLWEADSSFTFSRVWKEQPHYVISNYSFDEFLKYGKGDDVDEFAEILLSV
ncbi:hypothetical protein GE09DRAFT_1055831 [Coniochaeta sp. 2T2.1]|nr:hypothetical protein GE09DRAFT_1055831 [Coniochaeta sp. 2T2.1]